VAGERRAGIFVTGTDTGVGKTLVSLALIAAFRKSGLKVGAMKPIETGVGKDGPLDAIALRDAAGSIDPLATICPQQFALPAAPNAAADAEDRKVDLAAIDAAYEALAKGRNLMVVEGAGGLLVPIRDDWTMAELARRLDRAREPRNHQPHGFDPRSGCVKSAARARRHHLPRGWPNLRR